MMHFDGLPEHTECRECMSGRCTEHGVMTLTADDLLETVRNHMKREQQLELDSMYLTTLLDQLRQISKSLREPTSQFGRNATKTRLDQLIIRIEKDALTTALAEQDGETPSRESVHP